MTLSITSSGDHLQLTLLSTQFVQHQHVHIDGTEVIFQNADVQSLIHQVLCIFFQKSGLPGSQKARDQIDRYHRSCPFLQCFLITPVSMVIQLTLPHQCKMQFFVGTKRFHIIFGHQDMYCFISSFF